MNMPSVYEILEASSPPSNDNVAYAWSMLLRGVEVHWLSRRDLRELLEQMKKGWDYGSEELMFEFIGGLLRVSFLDDEVRCDPTRFQHHLELAIERLDREAPE